MPSGLPCTPYSTLMIIMSVTLLYSACTVQRVMGKYREKMAISAPSPLPDRLNFFFLFFPFLVADPLP